MLGVLFKFLIVLKVYLGSTKSTNVTLGLRYRHNDLESLESLIEFLENYPKLSMYYL